MNEQTNEPRDHADEHLDDTGVLPQHEVAPGDDTAPSDEDTVLRQVPYENPYGTAPDHDLAVAAAGVDAPDEERREDSGFHPVHVAHLVMGIAFLAFAGIWAALASDVVESDDLRWLLPVPWLLAGTVGLVASVAGRRGRLERKRQRRAYGA